MSKIRDAIIDLLSEHEWLSRDEIINSLKFKRETTKVTLSRMVSGELVIKKEQPDGMLIYKKSEKSSGFGVNSKISEFDRLLRGCRL